MLGGTIRADGLPDAGLESWAAIAWMARRHVDHRLHRLVLGLARGGIQRISTIQFLQPFSAAVAAWLLGEQFTLPLIAASAMILAGVTITQRR